MYWTGQVKSPDRNPTSQGLRSFAERNEQHFRVQMCKADTDLSSWKGSIAIKGAYTEINIDFVGQSTFLQSFIFVLHL